MGEQPRAFGLQAVAAEPEDVQRRGRPAAEVADELGGVQVAGRLAARDQEPGHRARSITGAAAADCHRE